MKKLIVTFLSVSFLFMSCSKDDNDDSTAKGLVSFADGPSYVDGTIVFTPQIQFGFQGEAVDIEYQVLDGNAVLLSEMVETQNVDGGMGAFFEGPETTITLTPLSGFSGKLITIWLDPENKVTSDEYTDDTNVSLWKKKSVSIP